MLKIKDDVDLRILEKYGFDLRASSIVGIGTFDFIDRYVDDNFGYLEADGLEICDSTREITGDKIVTRISEIEYIDELVDVFNFEVETDNSS